MEMKDVRKIVYVGKKLNKEWATQNFGKYIFFDMNIIRRNDYNFALWNLTSSYEKNLINLFKEYSECSHALIVNYEKKNDSYKKLVEMFNEKNKNAPVITINDINIESAVMFPDIDSAFEWLDNYFINQKRGMAEQ